MLATMVFQETTPENRDNRFTVKNISTCSVIEENNSENVMKSVSSEYQTAKLSHVYRQGAIKWRIELRKAEKINLTLLFSMLQHQQKVFCTTIPPCFFHTRQQ
jgi:hypothetical protein